MAGDTIIIKKVKKGGHSAHGGAWKVAYADFVTAMMAFFLLMWLLTATPVENLQGLADYFSPTLGLQGKMGIGFSGGQAPNTEGVSQGDWASQGLIFGAPPTGPIIQFPEESNKIEEQNERVNFSRMEEEIAKAIEKSPEFTEFKDSILIEQTPEGLRVQITDQEKRPMFKKGTAELEPHAKKIIAKISDVVSRIPNYIEIVGHTSSISYSNDESYTNWELSADRANATRRYLIKAGTDPDQVARVIGKADQDLLNKDQPEAAINTRVSVTLLRKSFLAFHKQPAPEEILLGPIEEGLKSYVKEKEKKKQKSRELLDEYQQHKKEEKEAEKAAAAEAKSQPPSQDAAHEVKEDAGSGQQKELQSKDATE